jgi:hypothetical protein
MGIYRQVRKDGNRSEEAVGGEDFHNGLAFVRSEDGAYGYIDKTGKYAWTPTPLYADTQ